MFWFVNLNLKARYTLFISLSNKLLMFLSFWCLLDLCIFCFLRVVFLSFYKIRNIWFWVLLLFALFLIFVCSFFLWKSASWDARCINEWRMVVDIFFFLHFQLIDNILYLIFIITIWHQIASLFTLFSTWITIFIDGLMKLIITALQN